MYKVCTCSIYAWSWSGKRSITFTRILRRLVDNQPETMKQNQHLSSGHSGTLTSATGERQKLRLQEKTEWPVRSNDDWSHRYNSRPRHSGDPARIHTICKLCSGQLEEAWLFHSLNTICWRDRLQKMTHSLCTVKILASASMALYMTTETSAKEKKR